MAQPDVENLEDRIDRDKRQREAEMLAFLLALFLRARSHADLALRLGINPLDAVRDVLMGNPALNLKGGAGTLAKHLRAADVAGYRRTELVIPTARTGRANLPPGTQSPRDIGDVAGTTEAPSYAPAADYPSMARQTMGRMLGTLQRRLYLALAEAAGRGIGATRNAVAEAFDKGGYVESATSKGWLAQTSAETLVGFAYSAGWANGWARPEAAARLRGFTFSATLDNRTTDICRVRDGTKVEPTDPWLRWNTPPLHFSCRSILLPDFGDDFTPAAQPPYSPMPQDGFGRAPASAVGLRYVRAA
jgi:SPP1 gp7 family putative phage head morphogenesis protein